MKTITLTLLTAVLTIFTTNTSYSQTAQISFEHAQSFSVLAASTVTNTGASFVSCNVGVSPGSSITGFDLPVTIAGTITSGQVYSGAESFAGIAQSSALLLYNQLIARFDASATDLTGIGLGFANGLRTLNPGMYTYSSSALLKDTLVLNDSDDPNAVFIIKIASTLTTASYSKVKMKSGGKGTNVFWLIGSSATIGTYTQFCGHIIAIASITMTTGCTTSGKLIALGAAVTMDTNKVLSDDCSGPTFAILPVKNLMFSVVCNNGNALLSWSNTNEINNNFFTVESSDDGAHWVSAGIIKGSGNSSSLKSYTFKTSFSQGSKNFYRLKQTDFDGASTYSTVVAFKKCNDDKSSSVNVYPNPSAGRCNLSYAGDKRDVKSIEVYTVSGQKVYQAAGFKSTLDLSGKMNGVYYVRLYLNSSITIHSIIIKKD